MAQVAARLGVATWTLERWLRAGQFPKPVFLQVGSHRKWRVRDIDAFIEKRRATRRPRAKLRGALAHNDTRSRKALQRRSVEG